MEWSKLQEEKELFIRDMILSNAISAAFQHAKGGVYKNKQDSRKEFQKKVGKYLVAIESKFDSTEDPYERIEDFIKSTANPILKNGELSFGIAQKLVNVYLKYLWCIGRFGMPPHCPIDSKVLDIIKENEWKGPSWTDENFNRAEYEKAIGQCTEIAGPNRISEWELIEFNGRRERDFSIEDIKVWKKGRNKSDKDIKQI